MWHRPFSVKLIILPEISDRCDIHKLPSITSFEFQSCWLPGKLDRLLISFAHWTQLMHITFRRSSSKENQKIPWYVRHIWTNTFRQRFDFLNFFYVRIWFFFLVCCHTFSYSFTKLLPLSCICFCSKQNRKNVLKMQKILHKNLRQRMVEHSRCTFSYRFFLTCQTKFRHFSGKNFCLKWLPVLEVFLIFFFWRLFSSVLSTRPPTWSDIFLRTYFHSIRNHKNVSYFQKKMKMCC